MLLFLLALAIFSVSRFSPGLQTRVDSFLRDGTTGVRLMVADLINLRYPLGDALDQAIESIRKLI